MTHTKLKLLLVLPIVALAFGFLAMPNTAKAATYTVTTTDDAGAGSLRQAIIDANGSVGADTIAFSIAGAGVHTITPATVLPAITDTVTIDGSTQPGASCDPRVLLIEISGVNLTITDLNYGIHLATGSSGSIVKGLVINRFTYEGEEAAGAGMLVDGNSGNDTIVCNYIGTNSTGDSALPNLYGILFTSNNNGTMVGGTAAADRNIVSGNSLFGMGAFGGGSGITFKGNYVGVTANGTVALGNGQAPLYFFQASNINVGGSEVGAGNVLVAGDTPSYYGILFQNTPNSTAQGNFIGTNPAGTEALGDSIFYGVGAIESTNISIGSIASGAGNLVSAVYGIVASDTSDVTIQGNKIGINLAGTACISRHQQATGVFLGTHTTNIIVGGSSAAARNIISCQNADIDYGRGVGVYLRSDQSDNLIQGNYIGTNGAGQVQSGFGNEGDGILLDNSGGWAPYNNLIGGTVVGEGNVIAGNGGAGINYNAPVVNPQDPDANQPINNAILGNSMHDNGELGIAFTTGDAPFTYAVTPNDAGDPDYGPNHLMNFPVIQSVTSTNGTATITYDLDINDAEPGATGYRVEFFANDSADASGYGEGQTYLGSDTVAGDVTGQQVTITLPPGVDGSKYITATTTMTTVINVGPNEVQVQDTPSGFGHTSEFAADVQATLIPTPTPGPTPTPSPSGSSSSLADTGQAQHKSNTLITAILLIIAGTLGLAIIGGNMSYSKRKQ